MRMTFQAALIVMMLVPEGVLAQDFDKGLQAALAGDYATAREEWQPLAEQGNANAQYNLGVMYDNGEGVRQDHAEAVRWFRLAAEQGHADAQSNLGFMYHAGEGVSQDYLEAAKWIRLAAERGIVEAQGNLGLMYIKGNGVPQDYTTAHMWLNLASSLGMEDAGRIRDELAKKMTPEDISEAQRRARACLESQYQDCG